MQKGVCVYSHIFEMSNFVYFSEALMRMLKGPKRTKSLLIVLLLYENDE